MVWKTWTAMNHSESVFEVTDPSNGYFNLELARNNPAAYRRTDGVYVVPITQLRD